jgi:SET domain-containing protein
MLKPNHNKGRLPHSGVYARLKPSKIHGVGVFAIQKIEKGTYIFPDDNDRLRWVDESEIENIPKPLNRLYKDFAIVKGKKYGAPQNFSRLTTAWYLNHSKTPNVAADKHFRFYALRDIRSGEELTADYDTYSDPPKTSKTPAKLRVGARKKTASLRP